MIPLVALSMETQIFFSTPLNLFKDKKPRNTLLLKITNKIFYYPNCMLIEWYSVSPRLFINKHQHVSPENAFTLTSYKFV